MSKIPLCIISLLAILLVSGCKDDRCTYTEGLNGEVLPDECYDCEWYAPDSVSVSWNDYNTVSDVYAYFDGHRETLREHEGDTLMITGWVCLMDAYGFDSDLLKIGLSDCPHQAEIIEPNMLVVVFHHSAIDSSFFLKKIYLRCTVGIEVPMGDNPCFYGLRPHIFEFDTIRKQD